MAETLEQLGKYTLDSRIAAGGMAEVFLATDDTGRRCVIKRMLPNLLLDKQFSRMFLDEAKLVVQLNHPSIAQVYDFGQDKGVLYLAMEWVDGTNLRTIVKDFARRGAMIPVEHCARLVAHAAIALGYAHGASGIDGRPLKIIHRDVSPQNILLSTTGEVKLIDFGVAKATSASQQTAVGMIKGKFAYMSPEQLRGNPLDGRSDIFGLGLVLYELLAAERAVPGSSEAEIAQNALTMNFLPIERKRSDVPAALKAILNRALSKDRDKRFPTAEALAAELEAFIAPRMPKLSGDDLAQLLPPSPDAWTVKEPGSDQNPITFLPNAGRGPDPAARPKPDASVPRPVFATPNAEDWKPPAPWAQVARTVINPPGLVPRPAAGLSPAVYTNPERTEPDDVLLSPPRSRLRWFLFATLGGFAAAAICWKLIQTPGPAAAPVVPVAPLVAAPPLEPVRLPAAEAAVPAPPARFTFTSTVPARVTVDGKPIGKTPVELELSPGAHQLGFEDLAGVARQSRKIEVQPGETRTEEWKPERGRVVIRAVPWAEVFLSGKSLGVTPIDPIYLLAGKHTFTFVNSDTQRQDEKTIDVKGKGDTMIKVDLRPAR
jgi:serine/threonine protein kinase